ncbi:hypothetical protein [Kaistella palustris]|uniref:hypothetical protein n=1 Tax=Kaistella palustris TaxID=493376 RepID=UPI00041DCFDE|nr:hypothetical protein [Kaistella palustris]
MTQIRGKKFRAGLFSRLRTQTSALAVDNYLKYGNQDQIEPENYTLQPLKINFMNWGEIGLNAATEIFPYSDHQWIMGGNVKYLAGFDAFNVDSKSPLQLNRLSETDDGVAKKAIYASNFDLSAAFVTGYNFETKEYALKPSGKGFGLDLGIMMVDRAENSDEYNFKAGIHILDVGRINFTGENHIFKGDRVKVVNNQNFKNTRFNSPQQFLQLLSNEIYGSNTASLRGSDFSIGLPTSLHINASKNIGDHQFLSADWIQRLPLFENALKRSNIFNLSYTVQKAVVGFGASTSLYEYRSIQFGGYLRVGPLILGSENIFPLIFKQKKLHSGDFYIAIKLYPFWDNEMKRHRREKCDCDR